MILTVSVLDEDLVRAFEELGEAMRRDVLEQAAMAGGEVLAASANSLAPGPHVVAEMTTRSARAVGIGVGPDKKHWYYQFAELGAKAHGIKAKRKARLRFQGKGGWVATKAVKHPGMQKRPFLMTAFDSSSDQAVEAAADVLRAALPGM